VLRTSAAVGYRVVRIAALREGGRSRQNISVSVWGPDDIRLQLPKLCIKVADLNGIQHVTLDNPAVSALDLGHGTVSMQINATYNLSIADGDNGHESDMVVGLHARHFDARGFMIEFKLSSLDGSRPIETGATAEQRLNALEKKIERLCAHLRTTP
jgi:hypothetical protein